MIDPLIIFDPVYTGQIESLLGTHPVLTPWRSPQERGDGWRVPGMVSLYYPTGTGDRWSVLRDIDRVVKLWDLHQEDVTEPSCSFSGPAVST